ncbi:MAG: hypothetical protein AUJ52_15855 [Elusimicrobia bacterium CG1_02_63_36]|nr:MAG: hypothetical protein AUJ52_15855 [Elusimicrobia bacterium CG1_02_63_36]PIP83726.1 MAG: hypothetical protein COR54_08060 [Elusimicrobia bacterium CG22_combo_CG10-13_8_21_14_all_63_91]PJA13643.1 MAG: hypothetical protein COX66_14500 [Elusimicrobia bacterium CG_4_10_14_0_2_um_filter_63_34]PJB26240.1 MAG: hypothetical protein CO113_04600 [Elusimicrobia bacterium CG_4_9_14_3_um_filter_62_55]
MESQPKSKAGVFLGVGVFIATGLLAVFVLFRGEPPPPPGTVVRGSVSDEAPSLPPSALLSEELQRREEEEEAARRAAGGDRMMIQQDEMTSKLLERGRQPVGQQGPDEGREKAEPAGGRAMPNAAEAVSYEESKEGWSMIKLSAAEQAQLASIGAGIKTPDDAFSLGQDKALFKAVIEKIGNNPKLTKYILDNEFVVKGFMSRPRAQRNCSSKSAAMSHYSNPANTASGLELKVMNTMLKGNSETPSAFASSKMMGAFLECPALQQIMNDPDAVGTIIDKNPIAAQMLQDPGILKGMTANPALLSAYMGAQTGQKDR